MATKGIDQRSCWVQVSVFWNPNVRYAWGNERKYKGCMGTRPYSERSDLPFKSCTRVWHKVSQVFLFFLILLIYLSHQLSGANILHSECFQFNESKNWVLNLLVMITWGKGEQKEKCIVSVIYGAQYEVLTSTSVLQKQLYWRFWTDLYCMNYWFPSTQYRLCYSFSWNRFRRLKGESLLNLFCCIT